MNPAQSLRDSAAKLARAGRSFDATFTRRMAEAATIHPEMYGHFAREQAKRADKLTREGGLAQAPASNNGD